MPLQRRVPTEKAKSLSKGRRDGSEVDGQQVDEEQSLDNKINRLRFCKQPGYIEATNLGRKKTVAQGSGKGSAMQSTTESAGLRSSSQYYYDDDKGECFLVVVLESSGMQVFTMAIHMLVFAGFLW